MNITATEEKIMHLLTSRQDALTCDALYFTDRIDETANDPNTIIEHKNWLIADAKNEHECELIDVLIDTIKMTCDAFEYQNTKN